MTTSRVQKLPKPAPNATSSRLLVIGAVAAAVLIVVIAAATLSSGAASNYVPEVTGRPSAKVSQTVIDHGDMQMEEYAESVFTIQNVGSEPLRLLSEPRVELIDGCCPPRAIVSSMTIPPGGESTIRLRFTMHNMMGGPHEFRVHVQTNDPTQTLIPLTILSNWIE
jgi:hypothetical protein